ncbi:MAG TPA: EVE domain-containing protein [Verrucomicrobiales bacterium]|nr:EVE domain-containing protein [Verrucomicrobiales bacterium]
MNYWLFKSEPDTFSFSDLKARPKRREPWSGVRNYQARNYMRDQMRVGDLALFYHSSCPEPGVAGAMSVASEPYPDPTQFDPQSPYFDPKATDEKPIWMLVDVEWAKDFKHFVPLETMRSDPALAKMVTLQRGNRLSITPVTAAEYKHVLKLGGAAK